MMLFGAFLFFEVPVQSSTPGSGTNPFADLFLGPIIGFIGFLVFIAGLAASADSEPHTVYIQAPAYPTSQRPYSAPAQYSNPAPTSVPPAPVGPMAPPQLDANALRPAEGAGSFCPFCGSPTQAEFRFCRTCGKEMPPA